MAEEYQRQLEVPCMDSLSFNERAGMLADAEWFAREGGKAERLKSAAKLRFPSASLSDVDFRPSRMLDKASVARLSDFSWMGSHRSILITGCAGTGKTWLACAFGADACRRGSRVLYYRTPDLTDALLSANRDGTFKRLISKLKKTDLLIVDDWCGYTLSPEEGRLALEVFEGRCERGSTILASQLPVSGWHGTFSDARIADAILDRVVHNSYRFELKGPSLRRVDEV
jgi:DNA replication protein DnaC